MSFNIVIVERKRKTEHIPKLGIGRSYAENHMQNPKSVALGRHFVMKSDHFGYGVWINLISGSPIVGGCALVLQTPGDRMLHKEWGGFAI